MSPICTSVPMLDVNRQNEPLREELLAAVAQICDSGAFLNGPANRDLEAAIADYCGSNHAIGCASGSDALLLALMALDIGLGDEVIVPSFTFFATASAVWRVGARPVFADICPDTFNIDPADVAARITPATRAIIPVHLFGQCAEMWAINQLAEKHNLAVIEDAAQAIGATDGERRVGSLGTIGAFSFYPTKNLGGCGDGGLMTTDDTKLAERLRILRDHGQHPRYYHHEVGLNSRLDAIQAAMLLVKLSHLDAWAEARTRHAARYNRAFAELHGIGTPSVDDSVTSVWNQYTIRVRGGRRDALRDFLTERKIGCAIYYPVPLHLQECFSTLGCQKGELPYTEQAADEVLSLPVYPELTRSEQDWVIDEVTRFCNSTAVKAA